MDEAHELSTFEQRIANMERALTKREIDRLSDQSFYLGIVTGVLVAVWCYFVWQLYTERGNK